MPSLTDRSSTLQRVKVIHCSAYQAFYDDGEFLAFDWETAQSSKFDEYDTVFQFFATQIRDWNEMFVDGWSHYTSTSSRPTHDALWGNRLFRLLCSGVDSLLFTPTHNKWTHFSLAYILFYFNKNINVIFTITLLMWDTLCLQDIKMIHHSGILLLKFKGRKCVS